MDILDIFYNHIIKEATKGRIDCLVYYNIVFSTKIIDDNVEYLANIENEDLIIPTLMIKDKDEFDSLLIEYVTKALDFYDNSNFDLDILDYKLYDNDKKICKEKVILALLFSNATIEDFNNPCDFLRRRIDFIDNDIRGIYDFGYSDILNGNVSMEIDKDIINNETPYQMIIKVVSDNGDEFVFPRIKLGISNDDVYIYAIQNKLNENNAFCKKINRVLYKTGEGFNGIGEDSDENLKDITSSFLVALNICISFLYNNGYSKIIVPSLLIQRWNSKNIANKIRYKGLDEITNNDVLNKQYQLQENLTNKLIRTFLRLGCHYNNMDILSFPYELDSSLHMGINDNPVRCNNLLLHETYTLVEHNITHKNTK